MAERKNHTIIDMIVVCEDSGDDDDDDDDDNVTVGRGYG